MKDWSNEIFALPFGQLKIRQTGVPGLVDDDDDDGFDEYAKRLRNVTIIFDWSFY